MSFVPGTVHVCKSELTPILNTPGWSTSGDLSLSASDSPGGSPDHGPFEYESDSTAWDPSPQIPSDQVADLKTKFSPAEFDVSANPHLAVSLSTSGEPGIELEIASASLSALQQTITLVLVGHPLLQVSIGPTIDLSVGIQKSVAEQSVQDEESEGLSESEAIDDVAEEAAGDAVVGIDADVEDFYGVTPLASADATAFDSIEADLAEGLGEDVAIVDFVPSESDPVPDDVDPGDAAGIDGDLGLGDVIDVDGLADLLILFAF